MAGDNELRLTAEIFNLPIGKSIMVHHGCYEVLRIPHGWLWTRFYQTPQVEWQPGHYTPNSGASAPIPTTTFMSVPATTVFVPDK